MAHAARATEILNSWKEIAAYLDRGVRTVQRWERDLRLPIHRIGRGSRGPVYASVAEVKFWLATSGINSSNQDIQVVAPTKQSATEKKHSPARTSHELVAKSRELVRIVAEASVRQQRQAEILQQRVLEIKSRMR